MIENNITGFNEDKSKNDAKEILLGVIPDKSNLKESDIVKGYDFNKGLDYGKLFESYKNTGFQASAVGNAIDEINKMIQWRLSDEPLAEGEEDDGLRGQARCKIFLGYTSNMASSGIRDIIKYLVQHSMVDVIVSTAGGIEEDFIKCFAPTYMGEFELDGHDLRKKGLNRIGNLVMPNDNYCQFESWIMPIFDKMLEEQKTKGTLWTPSRLINRLGREINNEDSIYYWAWKNNIPVYSPAITDGSIGDMLYLHSYQNPGLVLDIIRDVRGIDNHAIDAKKTGVILLGGGVIKHHILNANLLRNGCDFCVYLNTANEFDGSDSGAKTTEAVSWGKIAMNAKPVKIYAEASIVFPILVAETFAKTFKQKSELELKMNKRSIFE
ncbi:hypothetical protein DICPUDRAFT_148566 [Dictyostelium purpureum]|uniref:deoxyhypusine synthase n=1 Tax=Dictyostelium purpureum TaxID=5786 RepID=F0ZBG2_DICPU|nr:uncharacterized protein DICPUDRAFT_148566 [Dictyostelium purpureum]EGC38767.1 hypothetical protein DICPUDRAFT_148566 [Dictyostelium purpureum]|eukprot:XP_003284758.1 hypothetical protein DICPUDRAFT_148566 [Dictyostelium purpureum]